MKFAIRTFLPAIRTLVLVCAGLWSFPASLLAQITLWVESVPAQTPSEDTLYVAGNFNGWQPGDTTYRLTALPGGKFSLTLSQPLPNPMKYKFTRGSWSKVEGSSGGGFRPDRTLNLTTASDTVSHTIEGWEDIGGTGGGGTANAQVQILSMDFKMPQVNRSRRIWLYLPKNYATSGLKYPVLYLQDGQNLFDAATAFAGEWQLDETMTQLEMQGDPGIIMVGIDNGGAHRMAEYNPWVHPQYGGGEGDDYVQFIIQTLKPYIDSAYRTETDAAHTGILGSSMGGLISFYAGLKYPEVFGRVGVFSPSFWIAPEAFQLINDQGKKAPQRYYLLGGANEGGNMLPNLRRAYNAMRTRGFDSADIQFVIHPDGRHAEWYWAREFATAYEWLFRTQVARVVPTDRLEVRAWPNPATDKIYLDIAGTAKVQLLEATGRRVASWHVSGPDSLKVSDIDPGVYILRIESRRGVFTRRWIIGPHE